MPQAGQVATSTDKPITKCPKNMPEAGYRCMCLNASIVNKKNELNIMVEDIDPHIIGITKLWANTDRKQEIFIRPKDNKTEYSTQKPYNILHLCRHEKTNW